MSRIQCTRCHGTLSIKNGDRRQMCPDCNGMGYIEEDDDDDDDYPPDYFDED
jgi:DnaJ-class molecular chaperone